MPDGGQFGLTDRTRGRLIHLSRGLSTQVDEADFERFGALTWTAAATRGKNYAYRRPTVDGKRPTIYLHRAITAAPPGLVVDHYDGDGLNNRRGNLFVVPGSFNSHNRTYDGEHGRGVYRAGRRFAARIWDGDRYLALGAFAEAEDARLAYDRAALERFGPYARTNARERALAALLVAPEPIIEEAIPF